MNSDKAYLLGLITGGGHIGHDAFSIIMPFKQWGDITEHPERAGKIARDILERVQPIFRNEYDVDVAYATQPTWMIRSSRISPELRNDLRAIGYPAAGDVRSVASIDSLLKGMSTHSKKMFIAGLADTIGSLTKSHRRFTDNYQIISFEFKSNNFGLVSQLVNLLSELGCHPDQVLWNHPNQHSGRDRYYSNWRKGFKIRVALDDYITNGSFIFASKIESASENRERQVASRETGLNATKQFVVSHHNTVHIDEDSSFLPKEIRGYHFIHNQHIAAVMGCNTAPIDEVKKALSNFETRFTPFTKLTKGTRAEIEDIINKDNTLSGLDYNSRAGLSFSALLNSYKENSNNLVLGDAINGFPVSELLEAVVFTYCASRKVHIRGKRISGNILNIAEEIFQADKAGLLSYELLGDPNLLSPIVVRNDGYSALVGPYSPVMNKKLLIQESDLKFRIREPKREDLLDV